MLFKTLGIVLGISLTSAVARAEEPPGVAAAPMAATVTVASEPQPEALRGDKLEEQPHTYRWYGASTLGVDVAAFGLGALSFKTDSGVLATAALAGYALGGPVNHALHRNWGRAAGSLALRATLPVVMGIGGGFVPGGCETRDCVGVNYGLVAGVAVAMLVDATALSWEKVPERPAAVAPVLAVGKDMAYVGASGVF